jgi:hypothetical protein
VVLCLASIIDSQPQITEAVDGLAARPQISEAGNRPNTLYIFCVVVDIFLGAWIFWISFQNAKKTETTKKKAQ